MKVKDKNYSSIWDEKGVVKIIDQTKLPFEFRVIELKTLSDFCNAIKKMKVRGAPLIGVTAAYAVSSLIKNNSSNSYIKNIYTSLLNTRPTAVNLKWALDKIIYKIQKTNVKNKKEKAYNLARSIRDNDIVNCQKIAANGYKIIEKYYKQKKKPINILTHCNAGWLATVDWGTAISPIFLAHRNGIPVHVWVDETRPRNQGALLTAWELKNEKVPYTIVTDNSGGYLMQENKVDLCIVGSDRVVANGDVCNKIGTYLKAISASENNIPFFVALPTSTIDLNLKTGKNIPIEIRDEKELSTIKIKKDSKTIEGTIYFDRAKVYNPAFDVTPHRYITKLITEKGVIDCNKGAIKKLMKL
jgi:methylthioribose-1-phosphate isomerase